MKKAFSPLHVFIFLTVQLLGLACNGPIAKDSPKEKEHPKLIKTIGDPRYGNVNCILQDKAGNLWFGTTENGLYKYDGKSFVRFLKADGLNSNDISALLEDQDGKIWIGTLAGLCLYDPSNSVPSGGKLITEIQIPLPQTLPPNRKEHYRSTHWVFSMMQANNGKIWFATIDGFFVYDGKTFAHFVVDAGAEGFLSTNNNAERIFEDQSGNIWFGA